MGCIQKSVPISGLNIRAILLSIDVEVFLVAAPDEPYVLGDFLKWVIKCPSIRSGMNEAHQCRYQHTSPANAYLTSVTALD